MKHFYPKILILLLVLLLAAACAESVSVSEYISPFFHEDEDETTLVTENEYLHLSLDCSTTQFTLTDKRTGMVWYSNPPQAEDDAIAIGAMREKLMSQVILNYGQQNGVVTEFNNYSLSILNNSFTWELLPSGIKVMYTIGRFEREYIVPPALTESRMHECLSLMNEDAQKAVANYYRIIDINNLRRSDNLDELLEKYPTLADERMFELREGLQGHIMARLEEYFEEIGYTRADYLEDIADSDTETSENPVFNISVLYELDGPDFVVTVPLEELEALSIYPVLNIGLLPFFGAGGVDDEGFILVPDGSGALITFNNGRHNQSIYNNSVYGFDSALKRDAIVIDNSAAFPVFGISNNGSSFVCVPEDGAESASVTADVSGRLNSYNSASAFFTVTNWDDVDISKANLNVKVFERQELSGELRQRYIFPDKDGYVGMAEAYRSYLLGKYPHLQQTSESDVPFSLGLIGAIDRRVNRAGVAVTTAFPLTKYDEATGIISQYADAGINNLRVNYIGAINGGVIHDPPVKLNPISSLGGKSGFTQMLDAASKQGVDVFIEADFTFMYNTDILSGFWQYRDAAKRLSRETVQVFPYSFVWYGERTGAYGQRYSSYLAAPAFTMKAIDSFHSQLASFGGQNISFADIGSSLNSDFNTKNHTSRFEAARLQQAKMAELSASGTQLMIHTGNIYAAVYADFIVNMQLDSLGFHITNESVPFYQIVLRGLVPYSGEPINLADDYRYAYLKAVETGAGLNFLFMNAAGEMIQDTNYTKFFASDINRWGDIPFELYHEYNDALGHTVNLRITDHLRISEYVYMTEYEDGTQVYVNYGNDVFSNNVITVAAMDFEVIK